MTEIIESNTPIKYDSVTFEEILEKIKNSSYVNICKAYLIGYDKDKLHGEAITNNGNQFEYPIWQNVEFGEESFNYEKRCSNEIIVVPKRIILANFNQKHLEKILHITQIELKKEIESLPASEIENSLVYFEKIKPLYGKNKSHLVKATRVKISPKENIRYHYIPKPF